MSSIDPKSEMGEKICSQNREGKVSNYEDPSKTTAKSDIQGHGFFTKSRDGRFVDRVENHEAGLRFSAAEGGRTLTSAPVSTRKRVPVVR